MDFQLIENMTDEKIKQIYENTIDENAPVLGTTFYIRCSNGRTATYTYPDSYAGCISQKYANNGCQYVPPSHTFFYVLCAKASCSNCYTCVTQC